MQGRSFRYTIIVFVVYGFDCFGLTTQVYSARICTPVLLCGRHQLLVVCVLFTNILLSAMSAIY